MKRIEDAIKPVMKPLILGRATRLSPDDQRLVAAWSVMKTMIAEFDPLRSARTIHHTQRKRMMRLQKPPEHGWGVWIGHYERKAWKCEWTSQPMLSLHPDRLAKRSTSDATYFNSNSTTQIIGKLFIQVIHCPMPNLVERWRLALPHSGTLFRIWPTSSNVSIKWPGRTLDDRDASFATEAFPNFMFRIATGHAPR